MNQGAGTHYLLKASARIYSSLLILYPADYRREYGIWMVQFFRDVCRDTFQQQGAAGIMVWWISTLFDLVITSIEQRRKRGFKMSKSQFAQFTGIFFVISGICMAISAISQLQPTDHYSFEGIYQLAVIFAGPAFLFAGLGQLGLWARYSSKTGAIGQLALILAGLSGLAIFIALLALNISENWWMLVAGGMMAYTVCTLVSGAIQALTGFMDIPRWMPLIVGLLLLIFVTGISMIPNTGHIEWGAFAVMITAGLCYIAMGYLLVRKPITSVSNAIA
jgi:hypothetical protein